MLAEHEATVSRHLTRARQAIREDVERQLDEAGLDPATVAECFAAAVEEAGTFHVAEWLGSGGGRKAGAGERSRNTRPVQWRTHARGTCHRAAAAGGERGLRRRRIGTCPAPEEVAAWLDGGLSAAAAARLEAHAASCADCQALVAAFARTLPLRAGACVGEHAVGAADGGRGGAGARGLADVDPVGPTVSNAPPESRMARLEDAPAIEPDGTRRAESGRARRARLNRERQALPRRTRGPFCCPLPRQRLRRRRSASGAERKSGKERGAREGPCRCGRGGSRARLAEADSRCEPRGRPRHSAGRGRGEGCGWPGVGRRRAAVAFGHAPTRRLVTVASRAAGGAAVWRGSAR